MRQHLLDLIAAFPTLTLKVQNYTHTNGRVIPLFVADGTLPMFYQGAKYNIPLAIWLPEKYPRAPPIVYVVPTQDMMIKPRHSFVTPSGVVNSDYVRNWTYRSNLEVLGHDTSIHFGQEPPLFQKPPNHVAPNLAHHQHTAATPPFPTPPSNTTFHNPINRSNEPTTSGYPGSPGGPANDGASIWGAAAAAAHMSPERGNNNRTPPPPVKPSGPDLKEIFRGAAVKQLSERLSQSLAGANEQAARETDQLFEEQAELGRRKQSLDRGLQEAQAERSALETCVLQLSGKRVALERWLAENESKNPQGDIDPDTAIVPADVLSRQALDAQAEDLALEDTLYSLNKALQEGVITAEVYMKQVRMVSRKQFFVRALGTKVAQKQHDLRLSSRANQQPPQHVQMLQGDNWSSRGVLAS